MAVNNPEAVPKGMLLNARGEEIKTHPVTPQKVKRSLRKKVAYGVAAVGAAATMIGAGIAIEKTGKFPFGATAGESAVPAISRDVPPSETAAPAVVAPISTPTPISERAARKTEIAAAEARAAEAEDKAADARAIQAAEERIKKAQEPPTPTATPTDKERKDAIVAKNLGEEMARLQFEYDKTHPSPPAPIATPTRVSSGATPGQGNEGGGPWGFLSGSAITAVILGAAYRFRVQGGRLITAVRNRFGGAGGAGGGGS